MACPETVNGPEWRRVSMGSVPAGATALDLSGPRKTERVTMRALRMAGIALIAGAILVWFLIDPQTSANATLPAGSLGSLMVIAGLAVFAFGTRGLRRQVVNMNSGTLCLSKVNMQDRPHGPQEIKLADIERVFLHPADTPGGDCTLLIQLADTSAPVVGLSGDTREIESLHRQLCAVMQSAHGMAKPPNLRLDDDHTGRRQRFSA